MLIHMSKEDESPSCTPAAAHADTHGSGGRICLDFTNTASGRHTATPTEHLHSYADLLAWAVEEKVTTGAMAEQLHGWAQAKPAAAGAVLRRAVALRDAIYRIFSAHADGRSPAATDIALLNRELAQALAHMRLQAVEGGFAWQWDDADRPDHVLWPVAYSAADLLASEDLGRVRECAGETCNWLFIDRSKNRSRRWCDMQECGNVAKVRRYRKRKQVAGEGEDGGEAAT